MSWQSYVDDQLINTGVIKSAAICGQDGNIWAKSKGFEPEQKELKHVLDNFGEALAQSGIHVAGTKYMYLSCNDRVVRGKKGQDGVHIMKTVQALIVCVYGDPTVPEQAATVTEKLGEYLISVGY